MFTKIRSNILSKTTYKATALILLSIILIATSSCKSTKRVSAKRNLKKYGFEYLKDKMNANQLSFDYLSAKLSLSYKKEHSSTRLRGQMRIREDSILWLSFSPAMGIEAARLILTQDSIKFINRLNKTYFTGQYKVLDTLISSSIDYIIVQSMILANELPYYKIDNYSVKADNNMYLLTMEKKRKVKRNIKRGKSPTNVIIEKVWLDPVTFRMRKVEMNEIGNDKNKLEVYYNDYRSVEGKMFPFNIEIMVHADNDIVINVKYNKVVFNEKLSFPFRIPSKYVSGF